MERDLRIGVAIIAGVIVSFALLILTAGPDWPVDVPVAVVGTLFIVVLVTYMVVVYRRRLII